MAQRKEHAPPKDGIIPNGWTAFLEDLPGDQPASASTWDTPKPLMRRTLPSPSAAFDHMLPPRREFVRSTPHPRRACNGSCRPIPMKTMEPRPGVHGAAIGAARTFGLFIHGFRKWPASEDLSGSASLRITLRRLRARAWERPGSLVDQCRFKGFETTADGGL